MWKWLAIGIGILSLPVAFILSQSWMHGATLHEAIGWVLTGILAAQLTALVLRKWRLSLIAPCSPSPFSPSTPSGWVPAKTAARSPSRSPCHPGEEKLLPLPRKLGLGVSGSILRGIS
ncbi:hypothetical protein J2W22_001044 [Sphingomonas kyeonggiensis]|uniref:hypothetical protein n=1 Tax=Sphingomonas kyeonggiensis TaxID=1268553 RepID=UPI0027809CEE|nr:hypothetical protein [Sphingomonas kyeonggiensis]MDQ0248997.1 hypothetical protein [Sphingomonas kyeonggiensis]